MRIQNIIQNHNISGLVIDSRSIKDNKTELNNNNRYIIVALRPFNIHNDMEYIKHAKKCIEHAVLGGAVCALAECDIECSIPVYKSNNLLQDASLISKILYPSSIKNMIAVTGTNGKTSMSYVLYNMLKQYTSIAYVGTLGVLPRDFQHCIHGSKSNTLPEQPFFDRLLNQLDKSNVDNIVFEASSYGIKSHRLTYHCADISVFLNCHFDHVEMHDGHEKYVQDKYDLFQKYTKEDGYAIFNFDDPIVIQCMNQCDIKNKYTFSLISQSADIYIAQHPENVQQYSDDTNALDRDWNNIACIDSKDIKNSNANLYRINIFGKEHNIYIQDLIFKYQIYNVLASLLIFNIMDIPLPRSCSAYVEGRTYVISNASHNNSHNKNHENELHAHEQYNNHQHKNHINNITVVVDYAHNPASVFNILTDNYKKYNKKIVVSGAGGMRDKYKRAAISRICYAISDIFIITDDNYRFENPDDIRAQMHHVAPSAHNIAGRKEAIDYAIKIANENDVIFILGKGNEQYIDAGDKKYKFSDLDYVNSILK